MTPFFGLLRFTVHEEDNHHKNQEEDASCN